MNVALIYVVTFVLIGVFVGVYQFLVRPKSLRAGLSLGAFAKVSVPLLGTNLVFTPEVSGARSIPHFIFFLLCLYFGFFSKPKGSLSSAGADRDNVSADLGR